MRWRKGINACATRRVEAAPSPPVAPLVHHHKAVGVCAPEHKGQAVLVLPGVKFFTVAGAVFGFCAGNSVDNTKDIFAVAKQGLHRVRVFLFLYPTPPEKRGCTRSWKGAKRTPDDQRYIPEQMVSLLAIKPAGKEKEGWRIFSFMAFVFSSRHYI